MTPSLPRRVPFCRIAESINSQASSTGILHTCLNLSLVRYITEPLVLYWCETELEKVSFFPDLLSLVHERTYVYLDSNSMKG